MKDSLRVFFSTHHDGRLSGKLLRRKARGWPPRPPPSAYGESEGAILAQLDDLLAERLDGNEEFEDYLFEHRFETHTITVEVHPFTWHAKQPIIGKIKIPVKVTYAAAELKHGAWMVVVPRFDWWLKLEELSMAEEVIREGLSAAFRGTDAQVLYDFRREGPEFIRSWTPEHTRRRSKEEKEVDNPELRLPTVAEVSEDLVRTARRGKLPPIQFDLEATRTALPLATAEPRTSLLIVGGSGVGKTTWVFQLAHRLMLLKRENRDANVPRIWRTSGDRLIAGMVYLGMWQQRCLEIVEELSNEGDYLYVEHLSDLLRPQPDGSSIGELFQPAILAGELSIIAECTEAELERCQRQVPSLVDAFHVIRLEEPAASTIPAIVQQYMERRSRRTAINPAGLQELARLLSVFQRDTLFPGKAFRFLDWLGKNEDGAPRLLSARDIDDIFSRFSGLPVELISDSVGASHAQVAAALRQGVIGQDPACHAAAGVLTRFKAGLNDPEKPLGALLFAGPTGVGKTELAKQLARYLFGTEERLIRIDASEYGVPGAAQRLLDVGQGVQSLAERVRQQPLALVLIDEVEKGHPELFDLLLGILGEGRLTDVTGRLVDFRMTLVVMTSNLGVTLRDHVGFGLSTGDDAVGAIRNHFRPELVNRIDHVIGFRALSPDDVRRIVDLELAKAFQRLGFVRRELTLEVDDDVKGFLAHTGYDSRMGARPLKRSLEQEIIAPLARRLAAEPELRGRTLRASMRAGAVSIDG